MEQIGNTAGKFKKHLGIRSLDEEYPTILSKKVREETLKNQIAQITKELDDAKHFHTPEMHHFLSLEAKIRNMESRHTERENELQRIINRTKLAASAEVDDIDLRWRTLLDKKNQEIDKFREELDAILEVIKELHRQGIVMPQTSSNLSL